MSKKADELMQKFGGTIAQTVGRRPVAAAPAASGPAADKYAGAVRSRGFAEMPVDAIHADPQPRTEFDADELARLADSIRRFGQLAPIRVRRDENAGRWVVLVGERRLRACKLAGLSHVRVELVEREMSETDILAEQIVENVVRADLQPVEQARGFRRLMDLNGWTAQQLAGSLSLEPTGVYRALALLKLPEDVAEQVDSGSIKPTAAYEVSKLSRADDQRAVAARIVSEGLDHTGTVAEVRRRQAAKASRGATKAKGRGPAEQEHHGPRGVRVTIQASGKHTLDDIVADLRAIADELEARAGDSAAA
jgi:ParB family chromosome partitioning protein